MLCNELLSFLLVLCSLHREALLKLLMRLIASTLELFDLALLKLELLSIESNLTTVFQAALHALVCLLLDLSSKNIDLFAKLEPFRGGFKSYVFNLPSPLFGIL